MPKYLAISDTWLSHENRLVKAGDEFETTFPNGPDGKAMRLSSNLKLLKATGKTDKTAEAPAEEAEQPLV